MKLTSSMRATLERAKRGPLRRTHDEHGRPAWPAAWQSLRALTAHGLLSHDDRLNRNGHRLEEWTLTDAGREALEPASVERREPPDLYLAADPGRVRYKTLPPAPGKIAGRVAVDESGPENLDYTTNAARGLRGAGLVLGPPDERWAREAAKRHAEAAGRRAAARRAAAGRRAA